MMEFIFTMYIAYLIWDKIVSNPANVQRWADEAVQDAQREELGSSGSNRLTRRAARAERRKAEVMAMNKIEQSRNRTQKCFEQERQVIASTGAESDQRRIL